MAYDKSKITNRVGDIVFKKIEFGYAFIHEYYSI